MNETAQSQSDTMNETEPKFSNDKCVVTGIYKIVNRHNNHYYVGSSNDIPTRWSKHLYRLRAGIHHSRRLQRAWNKYGATSFEFIIIEPTPTDQLLTVEQRYLDIAKSEVRKTYNVSFTAGGGCNDPTIIQKIKRYWTPNRRRARARHMSGVGNPFFGKTHTRKTKDALRLAHIGKSLSEEHKRKIARYGEANSATDKTIYRFTNTKTGETFTGIRIDFMRRFGVKRSVIDHFIQKPSAISKSGWMMVV